LDENNIDEYIRGAEFMKSRLFKCSVFVGAISLGAALAASSASAAKPQTFTGTVGDAVCGAKHTMDGDELSCLRTCIQRGSKYDLVVGDKVYVLDTKDESSSGALDKLAGQNATVKGEVNGDAIEVKSVAAAR
jgi:hypothetical protein